MRTAFRRSLQDASGALGEALSHEGGSIDPTTLGQELWAVANVVDANPTLRRNLADPSREGADKAALAERLLGGKVGAGALHVAKAVVAQRWPEAGDVVSALQRFGVDAVLESAQRHGRLDQVEDELFRFGRIVNGTPELQAALSDRRAEVGAKATLVDQLLAGKVAPESVLLARQSVAGTRGTRFDRALEAFLEQAAERQQQVTATVISAVPLTQEQHDKLIAVLSSQYGRQVHANVVVDPEVVGGIKIEIGEEVLDGTVSTRLADVRRRMTA
ncbi:F0F1 ATP synthase subunit delta [Ornithinimicrobium sp. Y1694]|uniref:F0F1 ATP synthase subunit delta n=1 Tax=Ornithinimicrobium sp. Y1694 TaxID=3418590 RepID=UPI003CE8C128